MDSLALRDRRDSPAPWGLLDLLELLAVLERQVHLARSDSQAVRVRVAHQVRRDSEV